MSTVFVVSDVSFSYPQREQRAVAAVDLDVMRGEMVGLLGPNGSGKSTLLRLLAAGLTPETGRIRYLGRELATWHRAELARSIGVVTQAEEIAFPITVRELVAMGRYPHLGPWRREGGADRAAVADALSLCELDDIAHRPMLEISGGERQRARVARALAQQPATLLLDEPTASLDIAHEMALLELLARLRTAGVTIVMATHNINVAARFCDRLVLMHHGRLAAAGPPIDVMTRDGIEAVYHWPVAIHSADGAPQVLPLRAAQRSVTSDMIQGEPS